MIGTTSRAVPIAASRHGPSALVAEQHANGGTTGGAAGARTGDLAGEQRNPKCQCRGRRVSTAIAPNAVAGQRRAKSAGSTFDAPPSCVAAASGTNASSTRRRRRAVRSLFPPSRGSSPRRSRRPARSTPHRRARLHPSPNRSGRGARPRPRRRRSHRARPHGRPGVRRGGTRRWRAGPLARVGVSAATVPSSSSRRGTAIPTPGRSTARRWLRQFGCKVTSGLSTRIDSRGPGTSDREVDRRAVAQVLAGLDDRRAREVSSDDLGRAVGGRVVDDDELVVDHGDELRAQSFRELFDVGCAVVGDDDDEDGGIHDRAYAATSFAASTCCSPATTAPPVTSHA